MGIAALYLNYIVLRLSFSKVEESSLKFSSISKSPLGLMKTLDNGTLPGWRTFKSSQNTTPLANWSKVLIWMYLDFTRLLTQATRQALSSQASVLLSIILLQQMDSKESYSAIAKQLFSNPIKKIKLIPFLESGFSEKTLDAVIRKFTDRSKKKISIRLLEQFIKSFSNEHFYVDFLLSNFKQKEEGYIDIEDFMEIFLTDIEDDVMLVNNKQTSKLYSNFTGSDQTISAESLFSYAQQIGFRMDMKEAREIIRCCSRSGQAIDKYDFLKIIKAPTE